MSDDDDHPAAAAVVLRAVEAGVSADELRRVIDDCGISAARTRSASESCRRAALDYRSSSSSGDGVRCPLSAAHEKKRADLVSVLLESGADADAAFQHRGGAALLLAIHYNLPDTLRVLLRSGRHAVDERLWFTAGAGTPKDPFVDQRCLPLHAAVASPIWSGVGKDFEDWMPRLGLIDLLVREFGADINGRDEGAQTALHWLADTPGLPAHAARQALDVLLAFGAKIEARDCRKNTALHLAASENAELVAPLLSSGASPDVYEASGWTPLMLACARQRPRASGGAALLLRASSLETRRAILDGWTTLDILLLMQDPPRRWVRQALVKLLQSGVRFKPGLRGYVRLARAARAAAGLELDAAAAAREGARQWWRAHDMMVQLALDHQELRAAQEGVRWREARVAELERALAGEG